MKSIYKCFLCILALLTVGGCAAVQNAVLESKDVQFLKVHELQAARPTRLKISGLAFHSAMSVNKITTKTEGSAMVVLVHLAIAKQGTSGSFEYELAVPDSVNEVRFGNSSVRIWKRRPSGPASN